MVEHSAAWGSLTNELTAGRAFLCRNGDQPVHPLPVPNDHVGIRFPVGNEQVDALHLALAEKGNVDYFCTSDDKLLKRAKRLRSLAVKVVTPLELAEALEK